MSDYRDTLYTISKEGARKWVYSTVVKGPIFQVRRLVAYVLLAIYLLMPWITIGGEQAVFLRFGERKFTFFGTTFWATDTVFLFLVLAGLAISLFFFTAVAGRLWCGWACPETVFLEFLFRPIEKLIEGGPVQRNRLDEEPWGLKKIAIKGTKYIIFIALSWIIASTALAYFVGKDPLIAMMQHAPSENLSMFLATLALMGLCLFQFGWFREQFCSIACPYARFQSVMLDSQSLVVGYDARRGEPRGKLVQPPGEPKHGDCLDCGLCIRVCPTGIDIRNGLQLECIHCAACIDACNSIMASVDRPLGLIRYDTEAHLQGGVRKIVRPRIFVYAFILAAIIGTFVYLAAHRSLTDFQILRGHQDAPYSLLENGFVSNHLHLHVSNKGEVEEEYHIDIHGSSKVSLVAPLNPFKVKASEIITIPIFLNFERGSLRSADERQIEVTISNAHGEIHTQKLTLLGPE